MRVHLEDGGKILGFYPEEIEYPVLPDSKEQDRQRSLPQLRADGKH